MQSLSRRSSCSKGFMKQVGRLDAVRTFVWCPMKMRRSALLLALVTAFLPTLATAADTAGDCRIGAYRLTDGSVVDIGASDEDALRWRRFDGTTGKLHKNADGSWYSTLGFADKPDGKTVTFSDCAKGDISFNGINGRRIAFDVTESTFEGDGVKLVGRLVLPKSAGQTPIVVLIHGSETDSARDFYPLQRLLPAEGVGAFVYDKRGTGASGGKYTQDFNLLANDAVAAMREARRLAGAPPPPARAGSVIWGPAKADGSHRWPKRALPSISSSSDTA
jgi:uncharacterized protein